MGRRPSPVVHRPSPIARPRLLKSYVTRRMGDSGIADQFRRGLNRGELVVRRMTMALLLGVTARAGAQTTTANHASTRFDIAAGVTFDVPKDVNQRPLCTELGLPCLSPRTFPDFGLLLETAVYPLQHVALVGEASMYVNRWDTVSTTSSSDPRYDHVTALLVGPRIATGLMYMAAKKEKDAYRAFAQMLVGEERSAVVPTRFAVQPGAGIDFQLSNPNVWIRVTGDYRSTHGGPRNLSTGRAMAALVMTQ